MQLKPTVTAYLRLMVAHLAGRIQPPPLSPLGEVVEPPALPAVAEQPPGTAEPLTQVG